MTDYFFSNADILRQSAYGGLAGLLPYNVGVILSDEEDKGKALTLSWLEQGTSGQRYNNVTHMKVHCSCQRAKEYAGFVPSTTGYRSYFSYGYRAIEWKSEGNSFECKTFYKKEASTPYQVVELIYGEVISKSSVTLKVKNYLSGNEVDWGVLAVPSKPLMVEKIWEVPTSKAFYSQYWETKARTLSEQMKFDVYSQLIQSLKTGVNQLENTAMLVDAIKFCIDPKTGLVKLLNEASNFLASGYTKKAAKLWLSYRYEYSTTMLDLQSLLEFYSSQRDVILDEVYSTGRSRTLRGGSSENGIIYNAQFQLTPKQYYSKSYTCNKLAGLTDEFYVKCVSMGIFPTMANLWDTVPLSFVIDWVLPIGDYLSKAADERFLEAFDIVNFGESTKQSVVGNYHGIPFEITVYDRRRSDPPRGEFYSRDPSTKTSTKRVVDGVAMLIS